MSYRSIRRILGETNLERKCRFLFGACLLVLITGSFFLYSFQTDRIVNDQNRTTGRALALLDLQMRHWKNLDPEFGGMIKMLTQAFSEQPYDLKLILPGPLPAGAAEHGDIVSPDPWEQKSLARFPKTKSTTSLIADTGEFDDRWTSEGRYYFYQPIRAKSVCFVGCHQSISQLSGQEGFSQPVAGNSVAQAEGDLMAVARVTFPTKETQTAMLVNRMILLAMAIVTVFFSMVALYVIVRYVIVKPLRHLRDVSDAVSRGNAALRADIHTGDEFEELAAAFNRMLRHLTDAQQELRGANANLDTKVDELAQANMRLYELNMLKSDFLATMSHELRTPLNSILGFSEVLGSIDALDDKQKRYVLNIQKSGKTLLEMINDILDLAKIESGKMETRLSDFSIAHVIAAQCDMARPLTERKNIDLECQIEPDLPPIHQDQARVQQVLNNLLSNAIKFTPEGGRITLTARRDDAGFLALDVIDTGVGIAEEDQATIFEKFRQGRTAMPGGDAMTREYSGSGLGLSIVKELCKLLGGGVSVQSALGKGSTFTVRLPWILEDQPRLDAALVEELEDFTKQRFEPARPLDSAT